MTSTAAQADSVPDQVGELRQQVSDLRQLAGELQAQIGELQDREAIRTVLDSYAFLLDTGRWEEIPAAVFTHDAVDHHSPAAGPAAEPSGTQEISAFLDRTMRGFAGSQHLLGNSSIEVDGDTAHSRTYGACAHWLSDSPDPLPSDLTVAVAYDDTWRRTTQGWRISVRWVHTFGPHGLLTGHRSAQQPRLGSNRYGPGARRPR